MDTATLPDEVQATVERLGSADVVIGLATAGPIPALAAPIRPMSSGFDSSCRMRNAAPSTVSTVYPVTLTTI